MDLLKRYEDSNGNKCHILEMISREPEWAANRLQAGEMAIESLEALREEMKAIALATGRSKTDGETDCDWHDMAGDVVSMRRALEAVRTDSVIWHLYLPEELKKLIADALA